MIEVRLGKNVLLCSHLQFFDRFLKENLWKILWKVGMLIKDQQVEVFAGIVQVFAQDLKVCSFYRL